MAEFIAYGPHGARATVLVDDDVFMWLVPDGWRLHHSDTKTYVARRRLHCGEMARVFLHRVIVGLAPDDPRRVDHFNGDSMDNRRSNLRIVTTAQNAQNQGSRGGSSQYRGVSWDRSRGKWVASGMLDGRRTSIGRFDDEHVAGAAAAAWRAQHMPFSEEAA
jgi:hypothetical protein